jgi:hypothetical protein
MRVPATKTERDVDGWDVTLDVPPNESTRPLDLIPPAAIARVQVKTKKADFKSITVRVRTARAMALQPVPWFLICVVIPETEPLHAYVVHINPERIEKILRAVREAGNERALVKLSWTDADRVPAVADRVFARIREHVGDPSAYAEQKLQFARRVGYAERAGVLTMTVDASPEAVEAAVDAALGLQQQVRVREVVLHDQRFGVPRELDRAANTVLEASGTVPSRGSCMMTVRHGDEWAELEFGVFSVHDRFPQEFAAQFPSVMKLVLRKAHPAFGWAG